MENNLIRHSLSTTAGLAFLLFSCSLDSSSAIADGSGDPAATHEKDGKYFDEGGNPTFKVEKDGTVDWYTNVGSLQYGGNCLRCHGPDGMGSTEGPNLVDALKKLSYRDFLTTVSGGKKSTSAGKELVMPALGTDKNVMCNIDAIYVYLRGRSAGAVGRGSLSKHAAKPTNFDKQQDACLG